MGPWVVSAKILGKVSPNPSGFDMAAIDGLLNTVLYDVRETVTEAIPTE